MPSNPLARSDEPSRSRQAPNVSHSFSLKRTNSSRMPAPNFFPSAIHKEDINHPSNPLQPAICPMPAATVPCVLDATIRARVYGCREPGRWILERPDEATRVVASFSPKRHVVPAGCVGCAACVSNIVSPHGSCATCILSAVWWPSWQLRIRDLFRSMSNVYQQRQSLATLETQLKA
ncbi:hypothetical protein EJ06DRAFT_178902 [Trichodelitschia bisporula]|uniref:Uncharacterized protein n=1 Tax=Trichodelitschia bisporula TaxID=703511 RepID=A0A6G1HLI5_9PEZI|nr:hypothetical protein EJ06DRAFT_178902 [Trichodelitschia bisporula]